MISRFGIEKSIMWAGQNIVITNFLGRYNLDDIYLVKHIFLIQVMPNAAVTTMSDQLYA